MTGSIESVDVQLSMDVLFFDDVAGVLVAIVESETRSSGISDLRRLLVVTPDGIEVSRNV